MYLKSTSVCREKQKKKNKKGFIATPGKKDKEFAIDFRKTENVLKANNIDSSLHSSIKSTLTAMWYNPKDIDNVLFNLPEGINETKDIIPYVIKSLS